MLIEHTVNAIATELKRVEETIERRIGWNGDPAVFGMFGDPTDTTAHAEVLPFEPNWTVPLPGRSGNVPVPIVLRALADQLNTNPPAWLSGWVRRNAGPLLGAAFLCEGWVTSGFAGYRYGDLNAVPAMADAEARILIAVDTDGRLYQLIRRRGEQPTLAVEIEPTRRQRDATVVDAVYRLTHAFRAV
ncbi:hypothetical protein [Phytohabitans kaempferiae]|uniref:Uncharacterized protein n=1 Tax=Phytohabitans kaempferiae TaxID=1620943 RepID=A0ABV6MBN2_9ACTN